VSDEAFVQASERENNTKAELKAEQKAEQAKPQDREEQVDEYVYVTGTDPCIPLVNKLFIRPGKTTVIEVLGYCCAVVVVEEGITAIGNCVFSSPELKSITLPKSLKRIGKSAFEGSELKSIVVPDGCVVEERAFANCFKLESADLTGAEVEKEAFKCCEKLYNLTLPRTGSIRSQTFEACVNLHNICIPPGLTSIDRFAFYRCTELRNVVMPFKKSHLHIQTSAFDECRNITQVHIPLGISVSSKAFPYASITCDLMVGDRLDKMLCNVRRTPQEEKAVMMVPCYVTQLHRRVIPWPLAKVQIFQATGNNSLSRIEIRSFINHPFFKNMHNNTPPLRSATEMKMWECGI